MRETRVSTVESGGSIRLGGLLPLDRNFLEWVKCFDRGGTRCSEGSTTADARLVSVIVIGLIGLYLALMEGISLAYQSVGDRG